VTPEERAKELGGPSRHSRSITTPQGQDEWFLPSEFATRFRIHVETARDWLRSGRVRGIRTGRTWKIRGSELDRIRKEGV
jgi:excisionase family DNA binding protein